jgi:hypothetical protein
MFYTMLDLNISDSFTKLNFIGVVSLFGGEVVLSALRYMVLIDDIFLSFYLTMILSPGLQTVSLKMFKRMDDEISRSISGGPRDNKKDIVGLSPSGNYKYIGLHSGTKMVVGNILGEALIRTCKSEKVMEVPCSRENSPKRNMRLKVIELGDLKVVKDTDILDNKYGRRVRSTNKPSGHKGILVRIMPLFTIAGMVIILLAQEIDYVAFFLILLNVFCNMAVVFTIRSNGIRYPVGRSAVSCPPGDIFIEDATGTETYLVIASEDTIQHVFQKALMMPPNPDIKLWNYLHILSAYSSYIMVIVNIIALPFSTIVGQIIFGVLMFFGIVQNILLSTFDGDKLLFNTMKDFLEIKSVEEYLFQTRTSGLAFCMMKSGSTDIRPLTHLLPDTKTFETWFEYVVTNVRNSPNMIVRNDLVKNDLLEVFKKDFEDALTEYNRPLETNLTNV